MTSFYTRQQCGRNVHDVIFISINWKTAHLTFSPELQAKLEQAELKNLRLTEVFKKTSRDIREVCCYQLLGYKFDIPGSNQYRLMSMYAESPNDYLLFQVRKPHHYFNVKITIEYNVACLRNVSSSRTLDKIPLLTFNNFLIMF